MNTRSNDRSSNGSSRAEPQHAAHAGYPLLQHLERLAVHVDADDLLGRHDPGDPLEVAADVAADLEHALGAQAW